MNTDINLSKLEEGARAAVVRGGIAGIEELLAHAKSALPAQATAPRAPRVATAPKKAATKPSAPKATAAKKNGAAREAKRTPAEMEAQAEKALNVVKANGPINMENLAKATGLSSKTLIIPMRSLVKAGKVTTAGQKRATTYKVAA